MSTLARGTRILVGGAIALTALSFCTVARAAEIPEWVKNINVDLKGQVFAETTDLGSGMDHRGSRDDIHFQRLRLSLTGKFDDVWGFFWQTCGATGTSKQGSLGYGATGQDTNADDRDVRIIDAYVTAAISDSLNFKIGLTKIPLTRANLDDCFAPLSQDRSMFVYTAYGSSPAKFSRDLGVMAWGGFFDHKLQYSMGVFQGREGFTQVANPFNQVNSPYTSVFYNSSIQPKNSLNYVGRVAYSFLDPEPGSGYAGSYLGQASILTVGAGYAYQASAVYKNVTNAGVIQNGDTVDYKAIAGDFMFEYPTANAGTYTLTGQYLKNDFQDAYLTNKNPGDLLANIGGLQGQKEGNFIKAAYILPMTVGKEGLIQPYLLAENWRVAFILGVTGQRIKQTGGGINYYVHGQNVRFTVEYLKTDFNTPTNLIGDVVGTTPKITSFNTYRMMLQFVL
jgi:hypothetical protein